MNYMKIFLLAAVVGLCGCSLVADTIGQDATTKTAFSQIITGKAFDRYNGILYVATGANNGEFTIAKAARGATAFYGMTSNAAGAFSSAATKQGYVPLNSGNNLFNVISGPGVSVPIVVTMNGKDPKKLHAFKVTTPEVVTPSAVLQDAATTNIADVGVATSFHLCSGVQRDANKVAQKGKTFLSVYAVNQYDDNACVFDLNITLTDATITGGTTQKLDGTSAIIGNVLGGSHTPFIEDLYFDEETQILYAGLCVSLDGATDGNKVSALFKASVDRATGALGAFGAIAATETAAANENAIQVFTTAANPVFMVKIDGTGFAGDEKVFARIEKICGMKTTIGNKYLIVNGGVTTADDGDVDTRIANSHENLGNRIYALRLDTTTGDVVQNNADGDPLPNNWTPGDLNATLVGGAALPFTPASVARVTDMEVVGDAVYVSVSTNDHRTASDNPGVYSSRALFDNAGVVVAWTPWERVFEGTTNSPTNADDAQFISVDGKTGEIWQINGNTGYPAIGDYDVKTVKRLTWKISDFGTDSLPENLNSDLSDGCTSVLDLPKGTLGIKGISKTTSLALFGGKDTVVFARTVAEADAVIVNDYSDAKDYLSTTISGAGYVRCLGFSRAAHDSRGYFFAGTDTGLYVYATTDTAPSSQNGFDASTNGISCLDAEPFNGGFSWQKMATTQIAGPVTAIEANGTYLFVVEQVVEDLPAESKILSKLHRFTVADSVDGMNTTHIVIAASGDNSLPADVFFTGFAIVSQAGGDVANDWGILTTSGGIYGSAEVLDTMTAAKNWTAIDSTKLYTSLFSNKRLPIGASDPDVVGKLLNPLALSLVDGSGLSYYQNTKPQMVGIDWGSDWSAVQFKDFVNAAADDGGAGLTYLDRINKFWTDGGRRLFARFAPGESAYSSINSLPFYSSEWNMTAATAIDDLSDVTRVYWVENISGLGIVLAGTDAGVVALQ